MRRSHRRYRFGIEAVALAAATAGFLCVAIRWEPGGPWTGPPLLPGERVEEGDLEQRRAFQVPEGGFNILLISIDSLRHDHLGTYGYPRDTSPALDAFAGEGIVFEDHIAQASWTLPSHASMMLGQYPSAHGVDHNYERIAPEATTLALLLQRRGYRTHGIVSAPLLERPYGFDRGFDVYDDSLSSGARTKSWRTVTTGKALRRSLAAIDDAGGGRWFQFLHLWDVHYDYRPPPPFDTVFDPRYDGSLDPYHWVYNDMVRRFISERDKRYVISLYDGEIAWVDTHLGYYIQRLRERGVLDDTVVVITADHGEEFFEHGGTCHNHSNFEELVHVPLIVHLPGIDGPVRIPCRTAMIDLMPTLLELAGASPPERPELQGRSLLPLIRGDEGSCDPDREILTETVWSRHHVPLKTAKGYEIAMYRGRYKVSRRLAEPTSDWLFDLAVDPGEQHNLVEEAPEVFEAMCRAMHRHAEHNEEVHGRFGQSRGKKISHRTRDELEALGYVD